ncbi:MULTISPECIES: hybrid sensor histidine kinase/response regulator transcription factor [unclassified Cellulophaga]|uniref:hybrid sensor histidine kinase/response regulator transcription factor n=1 Tax=unclassified Cellulophaga TaxID=2634405 RepID=UPI0026E40A5E|nr:MULTISPECIES: hybrid sensor histidine kinase/response regulator transcription factor [unclassified Cellulophaga]MDO6492383.1 two-component regulator propeller domain-containing protein [Cellulophaga sp. 2_MG-2023]MDO6496117.1 two-component regulator propeller domain-containing protein [Cellulophaga sp. 3_MG-2023]
MGKKVNILIALFLCVFCVSNAQEKTLNYSQKLTISEGLAHNGVTSVLEDSRGFLWLGTYEGLNKYNGYEFKVYKNTLDQNILTSNRVRTINEDLKGNIWIGTDQGVSIYNYDKEAFNKLYSNKELGKGNNGPVVRKILINKKHKLVFCATEGNGILIFKDDYTFLNQFFLPGSSDNKEITFFDAVALDEDNYLFATSGGLVLYNIEKAKFKKVLSKHINSSPAILKLNKKTIIAACSNGVSIVEFQKENNTISLKFVEKKLSENQFNSISEDELGNLWLGTFTNGIIRIDNTLDFIKKKEAKTSSFYFEKGLMRVSAIAAATSTGCWVATFNEGIYKFDVDENPFKNYNTDLNYKYGLFSNNISSISPLDEDRVYVTASRGGVGLFNTKTNRFEPLPFNLPKEYERKVAGFFVDSRKNLWIQITNRGLFRIKKGETKLSKILINSDLDNDFIRPRRIAEDKDGNIWMAFVDEVFKIKTNQDGDILKVEYLFNNPFFKKNKPTLSRVVYVDPLYNYVWLGTDLDGLYRINNSGKNLNEAEVKHFSNNKNDSLSLPNNFVTSLIRLPNDELWLGTEGGGISHVLESSTLQPKFIPYTEKQGLSNNVVKGLQADEDNNLWISTNIGLSKFNVKDKSFRNFNKSDGLPFEDFWYASAKLNNGKFLFSGLDGFCFFDPSKISSKENLPKLQFDDFKIFNKNIFPGDTVNNRVLLDKRIGDINTLKLKHNENVFSLEAASLHFSNTQNHSIKYRLLPINKQWIEVPSNQKTIYYNGLQPGEYELSVMASNSLNEWTAPKKLKIEILPPFWKTTWAYLLYVILAVCFIYVVVRIILKIQSLNHKVEIEKIEKRNVNEVNEAKLRFFANISHEIKTPLTLISRPLDILSERFKNNEDASEKLNLVMRQSKKIQQLIEQVLDFRRADANLLKMNYSRFSFDGFVKDLIIDFNFLAENDSKKLVVEKEDCRITVAADKDKLEKVFNNLLNNAFKYTSSDDVITISYKSVDKDLIVTVKDTGRGIDSVDLEHIFERFYQSQKEDNAHISGSGIGLAFSKRLVEMHYGFIKADSEVGKGTEITVRLPIVKNNLPTDKEVPDDLDLPKEKEVTVNNKLIQENSPAKIIATGDFSDSLIFYAEDNLEMRNFVSKLLSKFFKVKTFRNGKECLEAMEDEWPDIVISDVQMPEMNGLDLCLRIKSDLKTSHIPVILLTALSNIEDHLQGIRDGADAYIKKPFNVQRLITNTEALLSTRKQLRERYQIGIPLTKENNKNNRNDNAFLEKLYSLIEENLDNQEFDLNSLAKELYLNRTHFYQKVKVLTNQTPFELLKIYRLKKAAELLSQKGLAVNEVYIMTGFKSRTHFAKIFKERYNISPGKYAAEINKKYSSE